jgi:DNA topoisomerase-3
VLSLPSTLSAPRPRSLHVAHDEFRLTPETGKFQQPRQGKNDDKAHPPIHPTNHIGNLVGPEKKVYEFIARRFLACCSKDAEGWQTTVEVEYGGEEFSTQGTCGPFIL